MGKSASMCRRPRYILAFLLLALIAYVQSEKPIKRNSVLFEITDELHEKANEGRSFENEDSDDVTDDIDNVADGDDSSDVEDSLEDTDQTLILTKEQLLSDPALKDLLSLLEEMEGLKKTSLVSDLLEMDPRRRRRKKRKRRHSKKRKHHRRRKHKKHKKHKRHEQHNHQECTPAGENEYACSNEVSGEQVTVTVTFDASTAEYTVTMMVNEQQEVQGSGPLGSEICGENSYCVEIDEEGAEKCVNLKKPEELTIGCFTQ